jgi:hypothetical protein
VTTALQVFYDVPVVPVTSVHQHVALGGPIWPDFAGQTSVRHCRGSLPKDQEPVRLAPAQTLAGDAVWGGFLDSHFGHFVADHVSRLPKALQERPDDLYLFTVDPGMTKDTLVPWVWQLFDWIGLRPDQVHLVTEPVVVRCLRVGAQAEMLHQIGPKPEYLALVEAWAAGLAPVAAPLLYVSRAGSALQGGGGHAGESYVVSLLEKRGVAVLDPGQAALRVQLAAYAGAEHIVFAEGSALHGRQLLGRMAQDITVIRRRPDKRLAEASLRPRCRSLGYRDVGTHSLMAYWKSGAKRPNPALSLYDVPVLLRVFNRLGVDLTPEWDNAAYTNAALTDAEAWMTWHQPNDKHRAEYLATLAKVGLVGR